RIVSFDFGTEPISPGSGIMGAIRLNIPAPTATIIRFAPADANTFFFNLPQSVTIQAGQTSATIFLGSPISTPTPRVGIIAHLSTQTPAEGVTGFFTISSVQLTSIELSSNTLSADSPVNVTVRFSQPVPARTFVRISVRDSSGLGSSFVTVTHPNLVAGATEAVYILRLSPPNFSTGITNSTIPLNVVASFGTVVGDATTAELVAPIQIVPLLLPDTVTSTQTGSILSTTDTPIQLNVRLRGANTAFGGTILVSTSQPDIIIPVETTIQVPVGVTTVPISLKIVDSNLQTSPQRVTVIVTDVNGQNPKQTEITLVSPNISSFAITSFSNGFGTTIQANVTSNANFNLNCGDPCYFNIGTIPQRTRPLGQGETLTVSLGSEFSYAAFDSSERVTGTITARTGNAERTASRTLSPSSTISADLSARVFTGNQSQIMLSGTASLSNTSVQSVNLTLESSLPSVIPPVFFSSDFITCNITSAGSSTRTIFSSGFSPSLTTWCMDVRANAVSAPTPVTLTLVGTTTRGNLTYTSRKSFTIVVEPLGTFGTPTPTRTPIPLINVATPLPAVQLGQNVTVNIATATPAPTHTPAPTLAPVLVQPQFSFSPGISLAPTPVPITLSLSVSTSTRRATVSISNTLNTDLVISISSSNSRVVAVPATVTIPRGSRSASFNYTLNTASLRTLSTTIRITVSGGGDSASSSFTVRR
ncbi:MAG: hypothetical protein KJ043_03470, partial [Anaerolineae bacterium]|nr:hypothetical protein [Anaerolineae bacterium]